MKREDFILAQSRPTLVTSDFVGRVVDVLEKKTLKQPWWLIFSSAPRTSFATVLLLTVLLFSGAAYAVTQLIRIIPTGVNTTGHQSFNVDGAQGCTGVKDVDIEKYEVVKGAPQLDTEQIRKIIQAKCELTSAGDITSRKWPSAQGEHGKWQDGETIYYDQMSLLGRVSSFTPTKILLATTDGQTFTRDSFGGKQIVTYDLAGTGHPTISVGDTVFAVSHFSQVWEDPAKSTHSSAGSVKDLGVIAVIKMSLPLEYYTTMQGYIAEVPGCIGNEEEACPNTSSIDVYPRDGGEGAQSLQLKTENRIMKSIAGKVVLLSDNSATISTFTTGRRFAITLSEPGFKRYNDTYASAYTGMNAYIKAGDNLMVLYYEASDRHEISIQGDQVMTVELLLEGIAPKESVNKY